MKCVCKRPCQIRLDNGFIQFFRKHDVCEFEKCPPHFEEIEQAPVDFAVDTEEVLMEKTWKPADAIKYIVSCGAQFVKTKDTTKDQLVAAILDARYRTVE